MSDEANSAIPGAATTNCFVRAPTPKIACKRMSESSKPPTSRWLMTVSNVRLETARAETLDLRFFPRASAKKRNAIANVLRIRSQEILSETKFADAIRTRISELLLLHDR